MKNLIKEARKLAKPFRVTDDTFRLKDIDPGETLEFTSEDKPRAKEALAMGVDLLAELQDMLYAQDRWAVLLIFQAMDAAGKDGAIKHVMSGINPQGCQVFSFKAPSAEDLDHDFLWRCMKTSAGTRSHRHFQSQLLRGDPGRAGASGIFGEAETAARAGHERHLEGTFSGHPKFRALSHAQRRCHSQVLFECLQQRTEEAIPGAASRNPEKNWKFSANDAKEREHWDDYMEAYEDMIQNTATKEAPWYVVPADNKWFTRVVVAAAVIDALSSLELHYPKVSKGKLKELALAKKALVAGR